MKKVKVGIVGTGYTIGIAKQHVKAYNANEKCELVALFDKVEGRAGEWAKKQELKNITICKTYEEMLDMVDAVSICTSNDAHGELSIKALESGVHVLCEKPMSSEINYAREMVECAKIHPELVNMIGFCYRGIPAIKYMKSIIDQGKLGKIYGFRQCLGGGRIANKTGVMLEWRMQKKYSGTGALADFGSHMIDIVDYLLKDTEGPVKELTAISTISIPERKKIDEEGMGAVTNDDTTIFTAKLNNGAVGTFYSSRLGTRGHSLEIIGEGGMLVYEHEDNELIVNLKEKDGGYNGQKEEVVAVPDEFLEESKFHEEINEFIDNIINNKQSERDFARGLYIQELLEALKESADNKKTVILD
ncbi:Gfo/Idh/MocA family protein [Vallitalea guaymasensis]|uniref:Gfo/Idh/MocA family oxidoreductase n=1 Tax=Vallitalea guaymasensis TaxID=1185412 RepID=A0A8J8M817_9FIRM|nr:Gfo/Idh/MocA family oxidoreductase [Vallitalea guaymasensis]QUH27978.1 Gfo/Idh/MocA family oxidoreductase [Vallitalea guaymasensis]